MTYDEQIKLAEKANQEIKFPSPEHKVKVLRSRSAARRGKPGHLTILGPYQDDFREKMRAMGS